MTVRMIIACASQLPSPAQDCSLSHGYVMQHWLLFLHAALRCRSLLLEGEGATGSKAITGKIWFLNVLCWTSAMVPAPWFLPLTSLPLT